MKLADLVGDIEGVILRNASGRAGSSDSEITGLTADSRAVEPGYLFAALAGVDADGAAYIPQALKRGAAAVLGRPGLPVEGIPFLEADEPRRALAHLAATFYPAQPECICAVTGTNGKTSVASFVRQIWSRQGKRAASIGTLGVVTDAGVTPLAHTTPDPVQLHQILNDLASRGITHVVMEASSHALAQYRLDGVRLSGVALTNITRDHLDYHDSFESYEAAKLRLFTELVPDDGYAVVNADSGSATAALAASRCSVLTVGGSKADIRVTSFKPDQTGTALVISADGKTHKLRLPLIGAFQVSNALIAGALSGGSVEEWLPHLADLQGAEGRMQLVAQTTSGASIYVDYAHTPDALETVLKAIRPHTSDRLVVVFGAGGDRDKGKRPLMGGIASTLADVVYVTDDNPRFEDAASIRAGILAAAPDAIEVADRQAAIGAAMEALQAGDVLVVAGKGHETGQTIQGVTYPFKDADVIRAFLQAGKGAA